MTSDHFGETSVNPELFRCEGNGKNARMSVGFNMAAHRGLCLGQVLLRRTVLQRPQVLLGIRKGKFCLSCIVCSLSRRNYEPQ